MSDKPNGTTLIKIWRKMVPLPWGGGSARVCVCVCVAISLGNIDLRPMKNQSFSPVRHITDLWLCVKDTAYEANPAQLCSTLSCSAGSQLYKSSQHLKSSSEQESKE